MTTLVTLLCACQRGLCFYCGQKFSGPTLTKKGQRRDDQWSRDHVLPLSKGGRLYILACLKCNGKKGCRMPTPEEMRRATIMRAEVDRIGASLQGAGWSTLESEKALVREKIAASHTDHGYRYPREEIRSSKLADALAAV